MQSLRAFFLIPSMALMVSACGGGGSQQGGEQAQQDQQKDTATQEEEVVNIYSHRHYEVDEKLYEAFEDKTGIEVNVTNAGADELMQKLEMEGKNSPADLLVSVDAGRLYRAKEKDLLQKVDHDTLNSRVPERYRDPDGFWYGLTYRARALAYHSDRMDEGAITTYEGLADDKLEDRLLIRSSQNVYNQSMIASVLAHQGEETTMKWLNGLVDNLARKPKGGDRDQIKAVASGEGDLAVVNTYYLAKMLQSENEAEVEADENMDIVFPNQEGRGAHVNISGVGVTKHAPHKENALRLMQYLTSKEAQAMYANQNYEYPVRSDVALPDVIADWSGFKKDTLGLNKLGKLNRKAVKMADKAGWR